MGKGGAFNVTIKGGKQLSKMLNDLPAKGEKAIKYTISDFRSRGPGWLKQGVQKHYHVDASAFSKSRPSFKAASSPGSVDGVAIVYKGNTLTLKHFGAKRQGGGRTGRKARAVIPTKYLGRYTGKGTAAFVRMPKPSAVTATIKSGVVFHEAFITRANGATLPFQRTAESPYPIKPIKTVSVPQMIGNDAQETINETINREMEKRFENQCRRVMGLGK